MPPKRKWNEPSKILQPVGIKIVKLICYSGAINPLKCEEEDK